MGVVTLITTPVLNTLSNQESKPEQPLGFLADKLLRS